MFSPVFVVSRAVLLGSFRGIGSGVKRRVSDVFGRIPLELVVITDDSRPVVQHGGSELCLFVELAVESVRMYDLGGEGDAMSNLGARARGLHPSAVVSGVVGIEREKQNASDVM